MTLQPGKLILAQDYNTIDPNFDNVSLLLSGEGANGSTTIIDSSNNNNVVTAVGDASISTAVADPFGNSNAGVLAFDGAGDRLTVPSNTVFGFGTGDFTVETWVYWNSVAGASIVVDFRAPANTNYPMLWQSNGTLYYWTFGTGRIQISGLQIGTFYHVALSRSNGQSRLFVNGVQGGITYNDTGDYGTSGAPNIGANYANQGYLNGYLSNLRITKGVARYTANFTPPTQPFFPGGAN